MSNEDIQLVGLSRNKDNLSRDKYYTKPSLAEKYVNIFKEVINPTDNDIIVEPSAGDGSFSDILRSHSNLYSYDIEPKKSYITELDFLQLDVSIFDDMKVHCIGNPPFGKNGNLANSFVKKCSEFAESISFILPKSFKKPSCYRAFPLKFHKIFQEDCPDKSFVVNGEEYTAECVFQIWIKKEYEREKEHIPTPLGYKYVKKNQNPHISVTRVGGSSGRATTSYQKKSIQSNLFITFDDDVRKRIDLNKIVAQINEIKHPFNNTVAARSIAKSEFTMLINKLLNDYK